VRILVCPSAYNPALELSKMMKDGGGFSEVPFELPEGENEIARSLRASVPTAADDKYAMISAVGAVEGTPQRGVKVFSSARLLYSGDASSFPSATVVSFCQTAAAGKTLVLFPLPPAPARRSAVDNAPPTRGTGGRGTGTVAFGFGIQSRGGDKVILTKNKGATAWSGQKYPVGTLEFGALVRMAEDARAKDVSKFGSHPLAEDSTELYIINSQPVSFSEAQSKTATYFKLSESMETWASVELTDGMTIRIAVSSENAPPLDLSVAHSRGTGADPLVLRQHAKRILLTHWKMALRGGASAASSQQPAASSQQPAASSQQPAAS
jgi:hypothetical protein